MGQNLIIRLAVMTTKVRGGIYTLIALEILQKESEPENEKSKL